MTDELVITAPLATHFINTEVFCTLQIEATHNWPNCPFREVLYLRDPHRHVFYIKAHKLVSHDDRHIEFICLKHDIKQYIHEQYWSQTIKMCEFGAKSCEMLGRELAERFDLSQVEVSEDNENGSVVYRKRM